MKFDFQKRAPRELVYPKDLIGPQFIGGCWFSKCAETIPFCIGSYSLRSSFISSNTTMADRSRSRSPDRGAPPADEPPAAPSNGDAPPAPAPASNPDGSTGDEVKLYVGNLDYGKLGFLFSWIGVAGNQMNAFSQLSSLSLIFSY